MYYWIWLSLLTFLTPIQKIELLKKYEKPEKLYNIVKEEWLLLNYIDEKVYAKIEKSKSEESINKYLKAIKKENINVITILDKEYPYKLKEIYDPPVVLYTIGDVNLLNSKSIGIVGSRDCSLYGKNVTIYFSRKLASNEITVVSGLAKGIDLYAHIGCLQAKGRTIAVLGNGINVIYPKENSTIYSEIIKRGGLLVSEYIINATPVPLNFPARNRIISGLSDKLLVVESKEKTGTISTVDFALDYGKDIYVVPGNIDNKYSEGTNNLIKQGASIVTGIRDIIN